MVDFHHCFERLDLLRPSGSGLNWTDLGAKKDLQALQLE